MVLLSHFSSNSGEAHGKSLLHIFSCHGSKNGSRARMAYWVVSVKYIPLPKKSNAHKTKADVYFLPFPFCILSCNLQETPRVRFCLTQGGKTRACQSCLSVFSPRALFNTPQRKRHEIYTHTHKHQSFFELCCFTLSHNCAFHLKISPSCLFHLPLCIQAV